MFAEDPNFNGLPILLQYPKISKYFSQLDNNIPACKHKECGGIGSGIDVGDCPRTH
jgi:hypothetical protein